MKTPVNFEIAQLLKEKGFDEDCYRTYNSNGNISPFPLLENMGEEPILNPLDYKWKNSLIHKSVISAPTIAEVVMWLYEKHGFWCYAYTNGKLWYPCIQYSSLGDMAVLSGKIGLFNSPTAAYEAAILYCLEKLI